MMYQLEFSEKQQVFHYNHVDRSRGIGYIVICKEISFDNLIDFQEHIDNLKFDKLTNELVINEFHNFLKH